MTLRLVATTCLLSMTVLGSALNRRQIATYPTCAISCVEMTFAAPECQSTDISCYCQSTTYIAVVDACVQAACTPAQQAQAEQASNINCGRYGINMTTVRAAATGGITDPGSDVATASAFEPVPTSAAPIPDPTYYSTATPVQHSNTVVIVGGVIGGIGTPALFVILFIVIRRRRQQRYLIQRLATTQAPPMVFVPNNGGPPSTPDKAPWTPDTTPNLPDSFIPFQPPAHPPPLPPSTPPITMPAAPPARMQVPTPPPVPEPTGASMTAHAPSLMSPSTTIYEVSSTLPPTSPRSAFTPEQIAMMDQVQKLSPAQRELIERMTANNTHGTAGPESAMDAPPQYDFKTNQS